MTAAAFSAPGKLILMGEHAVVYGHPALVAAVGLRLRARVEVVPERPGNVDVSLPSVGWRGRLPWAEVLRYAGEARGRWEAWAADPSGAGFDAARGSDPAHGVKVALGEAARFLGEEEGPGLRVEVISEIPVGSGFGSSAALAVALLSAYLEVRGAPPSAAELEELAREVERRQHGFPSGVDAATVRAGGVVWAEPSLAGEGRPGVSPLPVGADLLSGFAVYDTGTPAESTGRLVGEVRARLRREGEPLRRVLAEMGETTGRFRDLLLEGTPDAARCRELVRRFERGLEALGVVPDRARELVRGVEGAGGAAKISGAGALTSPPRGPPGAGCLLVLPPDPVPGRGGDLPVLRGLPRLRCTLGVDGCRPEPPARPTPSTPNDARPDGARPEGA